MIRIGFIFPSSEYLFDPFRGDPHTHFQILTVLEREFSASVSLRLIDLRGIKKEFALRHIPECDIYLHSVYTLDYREQAAIVEGLRQDYPKAKHIAGGPHANVFMEDCLKIFDSLILGDGEAAIVRAIGDFADGRLEKIYKQTAVIDVNAYPVPKRHYLPKPTIARKGMMTLYRDPGRHGGLLGTTVIFSRGCPYRCSFCAMPRLKEFNPGIKYRAPQFIEEEIEYLKRDYGIRGILLLDEIGIPSSLAQAAGHLEAIGRTGVIWRGQCRVDGVTPEIARLAAQSGCVMLGMGMESVSQLSLDLINKKISVERARKSIALLKENGIEVRLYMIVGLPGEPEDIVERTWDFINETQPDSVMLSLFTVRPGTEAFDHPEKLGIKTVHSDWDNTMHLFSRYEDESPKLTFEYEERSPWGRALSSRQIIDNYQELQRRLRLRGLCTPPSPKS